MSDIERKWMERALELAERGRGQVEPNPLVGAVLVRGGQVVGEGWHERFGQAHAEVNALLRAGDAARGAVLYVTLEPCCHQGKTPPCTDAVIAAGIVRVVAALEDPFPQVAGQGAARLREAGIPIEFGLCAEAARRQNAPYLKLIGAGRPYVHAKWAMSLDGKIGTRTGQSQWISNEACRRKVHALRGRMDGIVVGIGTAQADDPLLTARPAGPRAACRIVLDSGANLPATSKLATTAREIPVLVAASSVADPGRLQTLRDLGCEVLLLPTKSARRPDLESLLDELGRRRWTNLLVEGGAAVLGSFLDAGAIDEAHLFIAPILIGGAQAKTATAGLGVEHLADALRLTAVQIEMLQGDLYYHGWR